MKKRWQRKSAIGRPMQNTYQWRRCGTVKYYSIATSAAADAQALSFRLSDLTNYTSFTDLFDQYRINKVTMKVRLISPPEDATTVNTTFYPDFYVTVDHDDLTVPSGAEYMLQYAKMKQGVLKADRWLTYTFHPSVNAQVYNGVSSVGYVVPNKPQWCDVAFSDIPHYALKWYCVVPGGLTTAYTIPYEVQFFYDISFKNAR